MHTEFKDGEWQEDAAIKHENDNRERKGREAFHDAAGGTARLGRD